MVEKRTRGIIHDDLTNPAIFRKLTITKFKTFSTKGK